MGIIVERECRVQSAEFEGQSAKFNDECGMMNDESGSAGVAGRLVP
jgi:hypothetical protein